jgi:hypothetical protein
MPAVSKYQAVFQNVGPHRWSWIVYAFMADGHRPKVAHGTCETREAAEEAAREWVAWYHAGGRNAPEAVDITP